ncbi:MAG: hypothetical protein FJY11_06840 [Bacteroidetes bacterium]|nr:hypothetical protein [Bacteroidota bacterium]
MDRWERAREMNSRTEIKSVLAESSNQQLAEEELYSYVKKRVSETWDRLIFWQSVLLEETRKRGGTMGYKVGGMRNRQKELKKLFESY